MLYKLAHIIRDRFGFLWNIVEWCNAFAFALTHGSALRKIPGILEECSGQFTLRVAAPADAAPLAKFFAEQPEDAFKFFKPHAFDEKTLSKIIRNKSFLTFLVLDGEKIVGYFFLRCFVNGKSFRGKIVDYRYRGKGIAKLQGLQGNRETPGTRRHKSRLRFGDACFRHDIPGKLRLAGIFQGRKRSQDCRNSGKRLLLHRIFAEKK